MFGSVKILLNGKAFLVAAVAGIHYTAWQAALTALPTLFKRTYHFSESKIGLVYMANGFGSVFGTFVVGKLLDIDYRRMKRKDTGHDVRVEGRLRTVWVWSLLASRYLVDAFHTQSSSATASFNLVRCLLGAGGTAVVGPCINAINVGWTFTMIAGLNVVSLAVGGVLIRRIMSR